MSGASGVSNHVRGLVSGAAAREGRSYSATRDEARRSGDVYAARLRANSNAKAVLEMKRIKKLWDERERELERLAKSGGRRTRRKLKGRGTRRH